jgi:signal transduction histidine kinase
VQNAVESIDGKGVVSITLKMIEPKNIDIVIEDNGKGMTREFIADGLFRPFESTKGVSGMGVGVYQSRDYLRSLNGDIDVHSEVGVGSRFTIRLPVSL